MTIYNYYHDTVFELRYRLRQQTLIELCLFQEIKNKRSSLQKIDRQQWPNYYQK